MSGEDKPPVISPIICPVDAPSDSVQAEGEREEWEREQQRGGGQARGSRTQRSVSKERWVETMVVADSKLIEYHGSDNVESYIFTIMNMVRVEGTCHPLTAILKALTGKYGSTGCWNLP